MDRRWKTGAAYQSAEQPIAGNRYGEWQTGAAHFYAGRLATGGGEKRRTIRIHAQFRERGYLGNETRCQRRGAATHAGIFHSNATGAGHFARWKKNCI